MTSWDLRLDGTRRAALRVTVILDPALALICWAHYAPPIGDAFRKSFRQFLRWNDELPFVKFSIGEDERPMLLVEIPVALASRDALGLALARELAVADRLHDESVHWLKAAGWPADPPPPERQDGPGMRLDRPLRGAAGRAPGAGRVRRRGRALGSRQARALAIALAVTALLSVAAPGAGLLSPPVAHAAETGLTLVTNAAYTIQPEHRRIVVSVAITARNRTAETKTHKFSFDHAFLAVQPGAAGFRITGVPGATVGVAKTTKDARLLRIGFGAKLWSGKAATYRLTFTLPATGKGANPQVRVGSGLVTLPVWAFASNGVGGSTATVRFPAGWDVAVESGSFANRAGTPDGGTLLSTGPLAQPLAFFAFVSAQRPATYRETPIAVPVGGRQADLVMRAWTDDARWGKRIGKLLTRALPVLGTEIGVPWPHDDPIVVQEAVSREAGAYAGLFDPASKRIEVAYWASDAVALHEAAHAWFNGDLVAERWAAEGFASWYAQQAATELGVKAVAPKLTEPLRLEALPAGHVARGRADRDAAGIRVRGVVRARRGARRAGRARRRWPGPGRPRQPARAPTSRRPASTVRPRNPSSSPGRPAGASCWT